MKFGIRKFGCPMSWTRYVFLFYFYFFSKRSTTWMKQFQLDLQKMMRCAIFTSCIGWKEIMSWVKKVVFHLDPQFILGMVGFWEGASTTFLTMKPPLSKHWKKNCSNLWKFSTRCIFSQKNKSFLIETKNVLKNVLHLELNMCIFVKRTHTLLFYQVEPLKKWGLSNFAFQSF